MESANTSAGGFESLCDLAKLPSPVKCFPAKEGVEILNDPASVLSVMDILGILFFKLRMMRVCLIVIVLVLFFILFHFLIFPPCPRRWGLNPGPHVGQACALPLWLFLIC